jgi:hypothetical protein
MTTSHAATTVRHGDQSGPANRPQRLPKRRTPRGTCQALG